VAALQIRDQRHVEKRLASIEQGGGWIEHRA
jgi:hypothetical protein